MSYPIVLNTFPYIWKLGIEECLDHLKANGHSSSEIIVTEPHCWPLSMDPGCRRRIAQRVHSGELTITSLNLGGSDNNLASPMSEVRILAATLLASVIELAGEWGAKGVVMSPGLGRPLLPPPISILADGFRSGMDKLLPVAERCGVDLLLENIPYSFLPKAEVIGPMIESIGHPRLGVCYDVPNAVFARENPEDGFERLRKHIRLVHFSDTGLETWRHDRIGRGVVRFDIALNSMHAIGYAGPLVLEIIDSDGDAAIAESIAAVTSLQKSRFPRRRHGNARN